MSLSTLAAFGCGLTAGFIAGVLLAEKGKVGSQDLTNLSNAAMSKVRTAVNHLKSYHEQHRKSPNSGQVQA